MVASVYLGFHVNSIRITFSQGCVGMCCVDCQTTTAFIKIKPCHVSALFKTIIIILLSLMFASLICDKQCDLLNRAVCTILFCGRYTYLILLIRGM